MRTTNFKVEERNIHKIDTITYSGNYNVDTFHFDFDKEWEDLNKTLVLLVKEKTYNIPILNNTVIVPLEAYVSNDRISIGIFGQNENSILSTVLINIFMSKGAYIQGNEPENLPTKTQWDLYIEEINDLLKQAKVSEEEAKKMLEEIVELKEEVLKIANEIKEAELNIEDYNENAIEKLNEFNLNAEGKTENFNSNSTTKTTEFNNNASAKTTTFNDNATKHTTDFNDNATTKTTEYNNNASAKVSDYNTNADEKIAEFNSEVETAGAAQKAAVDAAGQAKLDEINSNQTVQQVNNHELRLKILEKKAGRVYSVVRTITNNSSPEWTRADDAVGLVANAKTGAAETVQNDFDNIYPWSDIKRCNVEPVTGRVLAYYGEAGYAADGSNGEVMVKIPEFWWKRERVADELANVYEYISIADYPREGYKKSEEFFVGAYLLSTTDEDGTIVAHSRSGAIPRYNTTKANFRNYAKNTGDGFCLLDYHYFLLQILYLVEYAHYNSQSMLGQGLVNYSGNGAKALIAENSTNRIIVASTNSGLWVGKTVCIGATGAWNSSVAADREITAIEDYSDGSITGKAIHFSGDPVNIVVNNVIWGSAQKTGGNDILGNASGSLNNNGYYPVSYRGIEDVFGHLFQHIDGINIKNYQAYICKIPDEYVDDEFESAYEALGYINSNTSDSYANELGLDEKYPEVALTTEVGASSATGLCDYYYCNSDNRLAHVGGSFSYNGARAGLFCWHCGNTMNASNWGYGARLLKYQ